MARNYDYWDYLNVPFGKKWPIGREKPFYPIAEHLVNPEKQGSNQRSLYYTKDQKKITELQKEFKEDMLGRKIIYNVDRCILPRYRNTPPIFWKPIYKKATRIVLECITFPGYRVTEKPEQILVITDQIISNIERKNESFGFVNVGKEKTPEIYFD